MSKYLPAGLLGLLFVGMLASVLSTIGGNLTFGAQVLVSDIYRRYLRPNESERHYVWAGRVASVLILALAILVAYRVELIFDVAAFMVAASVAEMPANWAQWWWWRFNAWGRLATSFGGLILTVIVWFVPPTSSWPWWDRTYLVIGLNMALTLLITLTTPPDDWQILNRFYHEARPLGIWRRVRSQIASAPQQVGFLKTTEIDHSLNSGGGLILAGLLLALIGAGSVMLMVVGLSYFYVGSYTEGLLLLVACLLTGTVFFLTYGPHLDRLERRAPPRQTATITEPHSNPKSCDSAEPISTESLVALAMCAYGVLIAVASLIWTRGEDLALNLLASAGFLIVAAISWWLGHPTRVNP
jgi:hypothetical protein